MCYTDGTNTVYGIYRGELHCSGKPYIDLNKNCTQITSIKTKNQHWHNDELAERYLDMARPFATPAAPAFSFTDCPSCFGIDPECHCKLKNPNLITNASH